MEKSIETIWKEGFINSDALVAPKINDLYNQKSQNIVDKFHRMFTINRQAIIAGGIIILVASAIFGLPYLGAFIFFLLMALLAVGRDGMKKLEKLDKNTNSYEYLKAFSNWRKEAIAAYAKAYTYFYPLLFLGIAIRFMFSNDAQAIINAIVVENPDIYHLFGIPWFFTLGIAFITAVLTYFGGALYRIDLDVVYGSSFKKLDDLIAEMEELRR
ncbi:hypothetical protein [Aliikangiella coralliicola]|uniref:Uncharacterized protein n=1 Tax=Aliikangiella coralliicola TaxID=2592383 RepID=A0A545UCJ8_9GAMM|nr:hypothetical protein [Aliikangiella coralliicola]TQV87194.1 hypothetical protein FLL46_15435 [Aliikangiella coralliicola]